MGLYSIQKPYLYNYSKNPVNFLIGTTTTITDQVRLGFTVQVENITTGQWDDVYEGEQRFDSHSNSDIDVSAICDSELEFYVPAPWDSAISPTTFILWKKQCRKFRIKMWETQNKAATTIYSDAFRVHKTTHPVRDKSNTELAANNTVLKLVTGNMDTNVHQGFAYISFLSGKAISGFKIKYNYSYTDGSFLAGYFTANADYPDLSEGDVISIFIPVHSYATNLRTVTYSITNSSNTIIGESQIVYVEQRNYAHAKIISYTDLLGGTRVLYLPFNNITMAETKRDAFQRFTPSAIAPDSLVIAGDIFQANQQETLVAQVDTGMLDETQLDNLRVCLSSPIRHELYYDTSEMRLIPIILNTTKQALTNWQSRLPISLSLEIIRAFSTSQIYNSTNGLTGAFPDALYEDYGTQLRNTFYLVIESDGNPFVIDHDCNRLFINYGDGTQEDETTGTISHAYSAGYKLITIGNYLMHPLTSLEITGITAKKFYGTLPEELDTLICHSNDLINLPDLPRSLVSLSAYGNALTSFPIMPPAISILNLSDNQITGVDVDNISSGVAYLDLSDNVLTIAEVDAICNKVAGFGTTGGTLILDAQTPAAAPTALSSVARALLVTNGWTVTTD